MIDADTWLAATTKSLEEMAEIYFDASNMKAQSFDNDSDQKMGAMIGLVSPGNSVQLMLIASSAGSESLAKALLGFEVDEDIDQADLADAMAEIVNIVAGMVKTVVNDQDGDLNLTLPTFLSGNCSPVGGQLVTEGPLKLGPVEAKIVVVQGKSSVSKKIRASA